MLAYIEYLMLFIYLPSPPGKQQSALTEFLMGWEKGDEARAGSRPGSLAGDGQA